MRRKRRLPWLLWAVPAAILLIFHAIFSPQDEMAWSFFTQDKTEDFSFIRQVYADISPAVVGVEAVSKGEENQLLLGSGSGLIFSAQGYIITNYHVVAGAQQLTVRLSDGREANALVIGSEPAGDLALLQTELDDLPYVKLGHSNSTNVGELVFPIGNPGGEQFARSMTMGIISGVGRQIVLSDGNLYTLLQTDAAINPGNSGGPLVDAAGNVIGINSVKIVDAEFEGMGFAIPIDTVREFVGKYVEIP